MSFRLRLTVLVSLAVAVAIAGTSFLVYVTYKHELYGQVDSQLIAAEKLPPLLYVGQSAAPPGAKLRVTRQFAVHARTLPNGGSASEFLLPGSFQAVQVIVGPQRVDGAAAANNVFHVSSSRAVSVSGGRFSNEIVGGVLSRVLTTSVGGQQVQIARSLDEINRNLAHLRWLLLVISVAGIGVAAILGALVANRAVAPLRRLTETTERIVETGDLSERVGPTRRDEIGRLGSRLDELLATLEGSLRTQRQLVADASHELRTPIATLRANIELLAVPGSLEPHERAELLADVQEELEAMTTLVGELVELARGEEEDVAATDFRLDEVVQAAVDRAERRAPTVVWHTRLEPSVVHGVPERIERAVSNLLDNARKWSPDGATVDVTVAGGVVEVRDRGPGISPEDMPLVFNRFYRSAAARGMPGAGLGLAIVKQIADAQGGSVAVDNAPDGGAILRLHLSPSR